MDWRTSPGFSSCWGQVYFQASRHLYCLGWREKKNNLSKCFFNSSVFLVGKGCQMVALLLTKGLGGEEEQKEKSGSSWNHGALPCLWGAESRLIMYDYCNLHLVFLQMTATAPPPTITPRPPPASRLQPNHSCSWQSSSTEGFWRALYPRLPSLLCILREPLCTFENSMQWKTGLVMHAMPRGTLCWLLSSGLRQST